MKCTKNSDCLENEQCLDGECRDPCTIGRPCPLSFKCTPVNHLPQCTCEQGVANVTHQFCEVSECQTSRDCPLSLACYRGECIDLCQLVKPCGKDASCEIQNHSPICFCDKHLTGDPYESCKPFPSTAVCQTDSQCSVDKMCLEGKCVESCEYMNICGVNAVCKPSDTGMRRTVYCECEQGFVGDPLRVCREDTSLTIGCRKDVDCGMEFMCVNDFCVDPCGSNSTCSNTGANCRSFEHRPMCYCPDGYSGNPLIGCRISECQQDNDCESDSVCLGGQCLDVCQFGQKCGSNAKCFADNHSSRCECEIGMIGNPNVGCTAAECISNNDCDKHLICKENQCINPCKANNANNPCGDSRICRVDDHKISCTCERGYTLDILTNECKKNPGKNLIPCSSDKECFDEMACMVGTCKDMCKEKPCGINAECKMKHMNFVAMIMCECKKGFSGNAFDKCSEVPGVTSGCRGNEECVSTESCVDGQCVDPCSEKDVCGEEAICQTHGHRPVCSCPILTSGDPNVECLISEYFLNIYISNRSFLHNSYSSNLKKTILHDIFKLLFCLVLITLII